MISVNLFHILFVFPLLLFIGYHFFYDRQVPYKYPIGIVLLVLGLGGLSFHSYRLYEQLKNKGEKKVRFD